MVTLVALLSFAGWNQSSAGEITHLPGGMKCADLLNDGRRFCVFTIEIGDVITAETFAGVGKLVAYKSDFADPVVGSVVLLDSRGGDVNAAYNIGRLIHEQKYPVAIRASAKCVSACVFILAAGVRRMIDGPVGIHRPYFLNPAAHTSAQHAIDSYDFLVRRMRGYLREMNVDARLADEMLRIDPDRVRYLSRAELNDLNLGEGSPDADVQTKASLKEAVTLKSAAAYGLSRLEYMRRNDVVGILCHLGNYANPDGPPDFASYGRSLEELKMPPDQLLRSDIRREEDGWSRCYKHVMLHGK